MNDQEFDAFLRQKAGGFEGPDENFVWENLAPHLPKAEGKKRRAGWLWMVPPIAILLGMGYYLWPNAMPNIPSPQKTHQPDHNSITPATVHLEEINPSISTLDISAPQTVHHINLSPMAALHENLASGDVSNGIKSSPSEFPSPPQLSEGLSHETSIILPGPLPSIPSEKFGFFNFGVSPKPWLTPHQSSHKKPSVIKGKEKLYIEYNIQKVILSNGPVSNFGNWSHHQQMNQQELLLGITSKTGWQLATGVGVTKQLIAYNQGWSEQVRIQSFTTDTFLMLDLRQRRIVFNVQTTTSSELDTIDLSMQGDLAYTWVNLPFRISKEIGKGKLRLIPSVRGVLFLPVSAHGYMKDQNLQTEEMQVAYMSKFHVAIQTELASSLRIFPACYVMLRSGYQWSIGKMELNKGLLSQKLNGFQATLGLQYQIN